MPLPSFSTVISNPIRDAPPISSLRDGETLPPLSRPVTPSKHYKPKSYLRPSTHPHSHNIVSVSPPVSQSTTSNGHADSWSPRHGSHSRLHTLGWIEYHLRDGTVYYVHPTSRVTTEINLRSERMLTSVEKFLADHDKDPSVAGVNVEFGEIWLRDVGTAKSGMVLEKWWVDHMARTVVILGDERQKRSVKGKGKEGSAVFVEEDRGSWLFNFGMVLIVCFFFGIFRT